MTVFYELLIRRSTPAIPGLTAFLTARTLSACAAQILAVTVAWQTYEITHSVTALGLIGLAQFLPMLGLVFVSGPVADRFNRKKIVQICQAVEFLGALGMVYASVTANVAPWLLYLVVACFGALRAFEGPCQQTFLPSIATSSQFPRAAALSTSLFQTANIVGPSLGGLFYGIGSAFSYAACAVAFFIALIATTRLQLPVHSFRRFPTTLASVFGGLAFLQKRSDLLGAISLDLFAVLLGGATALLPVYASDILQLGPIGLGFLRASPAVGALMGSLILTRWTIKAHAGPIMFASVALYGLAAIIFGVSHSLTLSVLSLAALGAADVVSVVIRSALTQLATPDHMRGRVSAVNLLFIGSSNQLGEFESGTLAAAVGAQTAVVLGGIGTLVVTGLWIKMFPRLWSLDRLDTIQPDVEHQTDGLKLAPEVGLEPTTQRLTVACSTN